MGPVVGQLAMNDAKYRCSETGYRIPLKCIDVEAGSKESNNGKKQNNRSTLENSYDKVKVDVMLRDAEEVTTISQRNLLDDSSMSKGASEAYITYRSCIPAVNEEKLSVLGFEGIIFCSLVASGSVVFFRRKQSGAMSGAVRVPTNPRF
ncbi:hypothetical protein RJ639_027286 [Escallonia herrerae]|uniref:Uncharacterized protein n=1 Tax=Escallonia herrerae TaxID=1293975 RepID=A0AA89BEY3_9ASTE|nr:hypothetical protein RJ639_027286 [Escallonia herrerae]